MEMTERHPLEEMAKAWEPKARAFNPAPVGISELQRIVKIEREGIAEVKKELAKLEAEHKEHEELLKSMLVQERVTMGQVTRIDLKRKVVKKERSFEEYWTRLSDAEKEKIMRQLSEKEEEDGV